jgi:DNA-binding response OmpR family regulator
MTTLLQHLDRVGKGPYHGCPMTRVLLVEDEPRIASFVSRALTAEGISVDTAYEGTKGLTMAQTGRYQLVILDLLLPGTDGFSVLGGIMEHDPRQRVLVLSAIGDVDAKVRAFDGGAADYLPKPFSLPELLARVRARLREPDSMPLDRELRAGSVRLDLMRRTASAAGNEVTLSEREFLLLQALMQSRGEVCTREQLLQDVWGFSFDPGSNVVDVYVGRLRAKLGTETIETVRNVGYRIDAG